MSGKTAVSVRVTRKYIYVIALHKMSQSYLKLFITYCHKAQS